MKEDLPYDVWYSSRRTILILGITLVLCMGLTVFFAVVAAMNYQTSQKVEPIFYEVKSKEKQIVRVEQGQMDVTKSQLLRSFSMRQYLKSREVVNHIDETERFKRVRAMSSDNVWRDFRNSADPRINKNSIFSDDDFTREIEITADMPLKSKGAYGLYRVEFTTTDKDQGELIGDQPRRWVALIEYDVSNAYIKHGDRYLNIDGVKIVSYQVNPLR